MSDFIALKFKWLDEINARKDLTAAVFKVAYALSQCVNRDTGKAIATQEILAKACGMTARGVRGCIGQMLEIGLLSVEFGKGQKQPNVYKIALGMRNGGSSLNAMKEELRFLIETDERGTAVPHSRARIRNGGSSLNRERPFLPKIIRKKEIREEDIYPTRTRASEPKSDDAAFEQFWQIYPRKVSQGVARPAFEKALTLTTFEMLIEGAERYALERVDQDPTFTKHPATWLNGMCWNDEPKPVHIIASTLEGPDSRFLNRKQAFSATDRAMAMINQRDDQGALQ